MAHKRKLIIKVIILLGYIALFAPYFYSVFYSMPANDDFPLGIKWWDANLLVEAIKRTGWNYMNWFGQSGVIAIMIQVLLNPLYWFHNAGHSFGICMIIVFTLITFGTLYAARRLILLLADGIDAFAADVFTFLLALMIFTSYYYNDVYNWWSGVPGYSLMMMFAVFNFGNIVKYTQTHEKRDYIIMILVGMITCTSLMNCVATGLFYLIYVFVVNSKDGDSFKRKAIPLICYIISGVITVAAPGNFRRIEYERLMGIDVADPQYISSALITVARVIQRFIATLIYKPWVLVIAVLLIILGHAVGGNDKLISLKYLLLGLLAIFMSAWGAVYPYILGSNKTMDSELANRIYFVEDYIVFIGLAVLLFRFGQWLSINKAINKKSYTAVLILLVFYTVATPYKSYFVPKDIVDNASLIKETWYLWDEILDAVESSKEDDVVLTRTDVPWCRYVYVVSLGDDTAALWPTGDNVCYCGVNQAVAKMYSKESVILYLK